MWIKRSLMYFLLFSSIGKAFLFCSVFYSDFFHNFLFVFGFLQFEYDMPSGTLFGIYPACCPLSFLELWLGGLPLTLENFSFIALNISYVSLFSFCYFDYKYMWMLHPLLLFHSPRMFCFIFNLFFFFLFAFQFRKN